jgi:hypothetical protein
MPTSYITDADRNFSADLSYRRRSPDVYSEAASNLMALPSQMTLLDVKRKQLDVMGADMQRRKSIFDEDTRIENDNELNEFGSYMTGLAGQSPEDVASSTRDYLMKNPRAAKNKEVMDVFQSIDALGASASNNKARALLDRKVDSGMLDLDWEDANRSEREEIATIASSLKLKEARKGIVDFDNAVKDSTLTAPQLLGQTVGNSRSLPPDVAKSILAVGSQIGYGEESRPYIKALSQIITAHGASENIMESYSSDLKEYGDLIKKGQTLGIDLDSAAKDPEMLETVKGGFIEALKKDALSKRMTPSQIDAMIAKISPRIDKAIETNSKIYHSKTQSGLLLEKLKNLPSELGDLPSRARKGDLDAQAELDGKMSILGYEASKVMGEVNRGLQENMDDNLRRTSDLKIAKLGLEIESELAKMENDKESLRMKGEYLELRKNAQDIRQFDAWLRMSGQSKLWEKVKDAPGYAKAMEGMKDQYDAREGESVFK